MGKKNLYPDYIVDPEADLGWDEKDTQRQEFEAVAFTPNQRLRMNLELTEAERKASVPWLLNALDNANPRLLAEVLRCIILKKPLWNIQAYQVLISQARQDRAMTEEQMRLTREWSTFIDKPVIFQIPGYTLQLTSDNRDITITGQPNFTVKVSNGKQYSNATFSSGDLDFWRRKAVEELERFKTVYETEPQQLAMDLPGAIEITLVRDARETMRPLKTEDGTSIGVEPDLKIGEVLAPVTVLLQLLAKKRA